MYVAHRRAGRTPLVVLPPLLLLTSLGLPGCADLLSGLREGEYVEPGPPARLAFIGQPTGSQEGREPLSPVVEVAVQDTAGRLISGTSAAVTLSLDENPSGATLSGRTSMTFDGSTAAFGDLSVALPGEGYTLVAKTVGLPDAGSEPFDVNLTFVHIDAGADHTCGVTAAGHAYCWGRNEFGQVGDGTSTDRSSPVPVSDPPDGPVEWARISAGERHSCGVSTTGQAYCWGGNASGELGDGTTTDRSSPGAVSAAGTFAAVSAAALHSCGVTTDGGALCWGSNGSGRLGDGTQTDRPAPVAVSAEETFAGVSAGTSHTCAFTPAGRLFCWGANASGQLGDRTTTDRSSPAYVSTFKPFASVATGESHTCGVTKADELLCWGSSGSGQVGDGSTTSRSAPVAVSDSEPFVHVGSGRGHSCGVTASNVAYCWGANGSGQLGDGSTSARLVPTLVVQ